MSRKGLLSPVSPRLGPLPLIVLFLVLASSGCVERKLFIRSDPPGALVFLDGLPRGKTPLEIPFQSYGTREVELRLPGYRAGRGLVVLDPPWYQILPFDFFCEVLLPFTLTDGHAFEKKLEAIDPRDIGDKKDVLGRGEELRGSL